MNGLLTAEELARRVIASVDDDGAIDLLFDTIDYWMHCCDPDSVAKALELITQTASLAVLIGALSITKVYAPFWTGRVRDARAAIAARVTELDPARSKALLRGLHPSNPEKR